MSWRERILVVWIVVLLTASIGGLVVALRAADEAMPLEEPTPCVDTER